MRKLSDEDKKQRFDLRLKPALAKAVRTEAESKAIPVTTIIETAIAKHLKVRI